MSHSFQVYMDESGDEGFKFPTATADGSSHWFVLSAVITRAENDLETVGLVKDVRSILRRKPDAPLHFADLNHDQRKPYLDRIGAARLRTVSVLIYKPLLDASLFQGEPYLLYRYGTRFLLERVSWFCRDHQRKEHAGQKARLIFSNRSRMSYDAIRFYLTKLRSGAVHDVRIEWELLDWENFLNVPHHTMMGLQIADAVASSMFAGVNKSRLGYLETSYARMIAKVVYRHEGKALRHGIKFFPKNEHALVRECPGIAWVLDAYKPSQDVTR